MAEISEIYELIVFTTESNQWECLFFESSKDSPPPRANAIVSFLSSKIYVYGGRTDFRIYDENIWMFDMGKANLVKCNKILVIFAIFIHFIIYQFIIVL